MIFSIVFTLSARHSAGFLLSVYGKVRFVVNKEMINTREEKPLAGSPSQSKPVGFASSPKGRVLGNAENFPVLPRAPL